MLHRIKPPAGGNRLTNILDFQRRVLALACDAHMGLPLTEAALQPLLGQEAGTWLWGKLWTRTAQKSELHQKLETILQHVAQHPQAGQAILAAFDADRQFINHLNDSAFKFKYRALHLPPRVSQALSDLLQAFYTDLLASGFPESVNQETKNFNRDLFLESFYEANDALEVCPACDGPRADTVDLKTYADADHFLPKSVYPFLSIHPSNLVPICLSCNRSFKLDRDPLDDPDDAPLVNSFHPYDNPAIDNIEVRVSRQPSGAYRPALVEKTGVQSRRVASINRVFKLEKRWVRRLKGQIELVRDYVASNGRFLRSLGAPVDEAALKNLLQIVFTDPYENRLGKQPNVILQASYVQYASTDQDEMDCLLEYFTDQRNPA